MTRNNHHFHSHSLIHSLDSLVFAIMMLVSVFNMQIVDLVVRTRFDRRTTTRTL